MNWIANIPEQYWVAVTLLGTPSSAIPGYEDPTTYYQGCVDGNGSVARAVLACCRPQVRPFGWGYTQHTRRQPHTRPKDDIPLKTQRNKLTNHLNKSDWRITVEEEAWDLQNIGLACAALGKEYRNK